MSKRKPQIEDKKLDDVVYFLAERMMRQARLFMRQQFKAFFTEITLDQWIVLKRVSEEEGISQIDIASSTFKDPAAVTRILDILQKKNLVERQTHPKDRRAFEVHLTSEGGELVKKLTPIAQEVRALGMEGIDVEEIEVTKKVLKRIYDNLK